MSCTKSSSSSLRLSSLLPIFFLFAVTPTAIWAQAVPSQANIDASAQRRLQEAAREAQRQQSIEHQVGKLSAALSPETLAETTGPVRARQALAALIRLRNEGISPDESLARAARAAGLDRHVTGKPAAYLRELFSEYSSSITSSVLAKLEAGEDPAPAFTIPPYQP